MGSILEFIRNYLDLRRESRSYCKGCEILREQLTITNFEKKQLLDRFVLVSAPTPSPETIVPEPIAPKMVPWRVKRELLEAEDRAKAQAIRRQKEDVAKASASEISVAELEKELAIGVDNG